MMKKVIALLAMLALVVCGAAYAEENVFEYAQIDGGLCITAYSGDAKYLILPETADGQPVIAIGDGAFSGNNSLVEVYIPDGYTDIGAGAFENCDSLRDVYIGADMEVIDERAFADCNMLLSVSIVQDNFHEDPTAYEDSGYVVLYNGADIMAFLEESSGMDYDLLYIAACDLMSRGEFEQARDIFLTVYGYELSADYYFYCSARLYEREGDIDKALAIYGLMPDLNDCADRIAYYDGEAVIESFIDSPLYTEYYDSYFDESGRYADWNVYLADEAEDSSDETVIGGADEPTNIVIIGGNLGEHTEETEAAAEEAVNDPNYAAQIFGQGNASEEPDDTEATAAQEVEPVAYNIYSGDMPFEYDDYSNSEGYYAMYYYYDDLQMVLEYLTLFENAGWAYESNSSDGWEEFYVVSPDESCYFMLAYNEEQSLMVLMYESAMDYGFDPAEGL